ncbi:unnamed protein product [Prunus armeniaca]
MTVLEYEKKFIELSKYCTPLVAEERKKCQLLTRGLKASIRDIVVGQCLVDFGDLGEVIPIGVIMIWVVPVRGHPRGVASAPDLLVVEVIEVFELERYIVEGVAPSMPCATDIILGLVSRVPQGAFIVDSRGIIRGVVYRAKCRIHISLWEPLLAMGPKLVRLADEEVSRGDVVEVLEQPTGFAHNSNVRITALREKLAIFVPIGDVFMANVVYMNSLVLVGDVFLEVDLIRLDIMDLDVILGMDWLAKHHASVDCFRKEVVFRSPRRLEVSFYEEHRVLPSYLISAMMARWLLRKGCSGYLAHVIDTQDNGLRLEDIPVVREFPDVFLEDLLGLPPEWEIEFTIELILRTNPIS